MDQPQIHYRLSKSNLFCDDKNTVKKMAQKKCKKNIKRRNFFLQQRWKSGKKYFCFAVLRLTTNILRRLRNVLRGQVIPASPAFRNSAPLYTYCWVYIYQNYNPCFGRILNKCSFQIRCLFKREPPAAEGAS